MVTFLRDPKNQTTKIKINKYKPCKKDSIIRNEKTSKSKIKKVMNDKETHKISILQLKLKFKFKKKKKLDKCLD